MAATLHVVHLPIGALRNRAASIMRISMDNTMNARATIFPIAGSARRRKPNPAEEKESQERILEARRRHEAHDREVNSESIPPVQNAQGPQRATEGTPKYYAHDCSLLKEPLVASFCVLFCASLLDGLLPMLPVKV